MSSLPKFLIPIGVGVLVGGSLAYILFRQAPSTQPEDTNSPISQQSPTNSPKEAVTPPLIKENPLPIEPDNSALPFSPKNRSPQELAETIASILQFGAESNIENLAKAGLLNQIDMEALKALMNRQKIQLDPKKPIHEIGELERQKKFRWSINLADGRRLLVDLQRLENGKWGIAKITTIPTPDKSKPNDIPTVEIEDPLGVTDAFLRATIRQQFAQAHYLVDSTKVNDATIAGLCIIFEEGEYLLKQQLPLRNLFNTETTAGFLGYVVSKDGKQAGSIGFTLAKMPTGKWKITDVMLDNLLQDYTKNFADGDAYFTPIVKNPKGGDSIALFFGFNEAMLSNRSQKQLRIIAELLKIDPTKKIQISGHTDDIGSDSYNQQLSEARAEAVKQCLISSGLQPEQIITHGFGKKQPRRTITPNADKEDNQIRRANRRAEIYLDF